MVSGLVVRSLALVLLLTGSASAQGPSRQPARPAAAADTRGDIWTYTIRSGDTLISICRAYLRDPREWPAIARLNRIADPTRLRVGSILQVPFDLLRTFAGGADVVWSRGTVRVVAADGRARDASRGERIDAGARIETGPQSAVRLRLIDGALLLIGENSRLTLDELTVFVLPGTTRTRLGLGNGRVETQVEPPTSPGSRYEIRTPVLTTAVRGTDFRVAAGENAQTARAEVVAGQVGAEAGGSTAVVDAGFGIVSTVNAPLGPPRPLPPTPDLSGTTRRIERLPAAVTWPTVAGAARYRVQLFADEAERPQVADAVVARSEIRWPDLADGRYALRVRAIDEAGIEGRDGEVTLDVKARPQPPFASAPPLGARLYGDRAEFIWTRSEGAASYDFQVATDAAFGALVVDEAGRSSTTATQALPPGTYYWRVASRAAAGDRGPFGDALSFTLRKYPEGRAAGAAVAKNTLTLRWSAGTSGETSQFQLAEDGGFARILADRTLTGNEVTLPRPKPGTYYLRVRAIDADGVSGPFGPTQQIDVPKLPRRKWWLWLIPPAVAGVVWGLL